MIGKASREGLSLVASICYLPFETIVRTFSRVVRHLSLTEPVDVDQHEFSIRDSVGYAPTPRFPRLFGRHGQEFGDSSRVMIRTRASLDGGGNRRQPLRVAGAQCSRHPLKFKFIVRQLCSCQTGC